LHRVTRDVVDACLALGFAGAGVCAARPSLRGAELREWLGEGQHGTMEWMAERVEERVDVGRVIAGRSVRSVVVVGDQYAERASEMVPNPPPGFPVAAGGGAGKIARYARGRDYHDVVRKRLHALADRLRERFAGEEFRAFVDTAPVMEREHAARAGLGFVGKHTLLIDPRHGSWMVLGGIATTMSLEPTDAEQDEQDHCGTCTRCIDACPTGAIEPWKVDARKCISYLTIEHEGLIDPDLAVGMGDWIFGCDICQEACPYNAPRGDGASASRVHPLYRERGEVREGRLSLLEVLRWSAADRQVKLTVSASKRASLEMIRRNAVIAAVNGDAAGELRAEVRRIAIEEVGIVGETARGMLRKKDGIEA